MKKYLSLLFISLVFGILNAQVTLYQCIDAALKKSYDMKIESKNIQKQKYELQNAAYSFLPSIKLSKTISKANNDYKLTEDGFSASAQLNLFDKRFFNYKLSSIALEQTKLDYKNKRNNLIIEVTDYYLGILLLKEKVEYYKNLLADYDVQKQFMEKLLKTGAKTLFDKYSVEVEIKNSEIEYEKAKNDLQETLMYLVYLTGFSQEQLMNAVDFDVDIFGIPQTDSCEKSYRILSAKLLLKQTKLEKLSTLTDILPDVYALAGVSYLQQKNYYSWLFNGSWTKTWQVSLNFQFDLGNIFSSINNYKISKINLYQQKIRLENEKSLMKLNLNSQKNSLLLIKKQLKLDEKKLKYASLKFEFAKKSFKNGLLDFFKFKESANQLLSAKISLINDKKSYIKNLMEYQKISGEKILNKY